MKNLFLKLSSQLLLLNLFWVLLPANLSAQVYNGNLTLNTQTAVDTFSYSSVNGTLRIEGAGITNLDGLSSLTSVRTLELYNCLALTSILGLHNLNSVQGDLIFFNSSSLTNLNGLSGITSIGSSLYLQNNGSLTNLDGLSNLTSVSSSFFIAFNGTLPNVDGLSSLTSVGNLFILGNNLLTNLDGLSSLSSISSTLEVKSNGNLSSFCGLYRVIKTGGFPNYTMTGNATNPSQADILSGGPCAGVPVPTLSEWGLILLGMILLALGVVAAEQPQRRLSLEVLRDTDLQLLMRCWAAMLLVGLSVIGLAALGFGYAPTLADACCMPLAAGIAGFVAARVMGASKEISF